MNEQTKAIIDQTDWPKRREDATADALIVHSARLSLAAYAEAHKLSTPAFELPSDSPEYKPAMAAYLDALSTALVESQLAAALVLVQKRSPEEADLLASALYEYTEDGGILTELMFDYLNERGIDADAVWAAAEESAR